MEHVVILSLGRIRSVGYMRLARHPHISDAIKGSRKAVRPAATRANQQIFSVFPVLGSLVNFSDRTFNSSARFPPAL